MTTAMDAIFVPMAIALLTDLGIVAQLSSVTLGKYDGFTGVKAPDVTTVQQVMVSPPFPSEQYSPDGAITETRFEDVYMSTVLIDGVTALTPPDISGDTLTIAGGVFPVRKVGTLYSGDDVAVYIVTIERG